MAAINKKWHLAVLLLPMVMLILLWGQMQWRLSQAPAVTLPIVGYDPRDLLYGHFIRYKLPMPADVKDEGDCVCIAVPNSMSRIACAEPTAPQSTACLLILPRHDAKLTDAHEFYVPEDYASRLNELLLSGQQRFAIMFKVMSGGLVARQLLINDQPWQDYLQADK